MENKVINWGIIGCGDVTEIKSGPAFSKVTHSYLKAVMRRNADKAEDYAHRHQVPQWYTDADELLANKTINAIYIATPPSSHEELTIKALQSGKDVYVEKPMALSASACYRMKTVAKENGCKLTVAHYRRFMPYFAKIRELLEKGAIGDVYSVNLKLLQGIENSVVAQTSESWRLNPSISGGGLFYDLAPHQLDLMLYFFGKVKRASGIAVGVKNVHDRVSGQILFENNVLFNGFWSFNNASSENADLCEIIGNKGKISFGFFGCDKIVVRNGENEEVIQVTHPKHVQQPMIERVVAYFLNHEGNPCDASDGEEVLRLMEVFTN